jgi:multidrug resistance efflux pump
MDQDADSPPAPPAESAAGSGSRKGAAIVAALILISLGLYLVGDRLTPSTSQARIQAFVVPIVAEAAGKVVKVHIRDNDEVRLGQPLFDIDPVPYEIALQSAQAAYHLARDTVAAR